jgi:AcrR family transcriptional regulator
MSDVKREYRAPAREALAAQTRARIVEAARTLLVRQGMAATTIVALAREAGCSPQTVYAVFGTKAGVLLALLDRMEADADPARLAREVAAAAGAPRRQLGASVAFHRRLFEPWAEVIAIAHGATAADPEVAAWVAEGHRRRHAGQARLAQEWAAVGVLRPGLSGQRAADTLWALLSPDFYLLVVGQLGWRPTRYERWLSALLARELFAGARHPVGNSQP